MKRLSVFAALLAVSGMVTAEPLGLLDRNGSFVAVEPYGPNIVRITLSLEKERVVAAAGYGFLGAADAKGWKHNVAAAGDVFTSSVMSVEVKAQPLPSPPRPQPLPLRALSRKMPAPDRSLP